MENLTRLSVWDYVVFAGTLLISVSIGIYYAIKSHQTTVDYMLGGRKLPWFPVALSMTTSFMSAIIVLGTPSEVYYFGTMYWWTSVTYVIMTIVTCTVYIPVFCNLDLTSCYKYLDLRFNKVVRTAGTVAYLIQTILYLGLVTYLPALALNQVTSLSLWGSLLATGAACVLYSTVGGLRGIVMADCFQLLIMFCGLLAVVITGCVKAGGISQVFENAQNSGNLIFDDISFDPRIRHTVWSLLIGGTFTWVSNYGIGQSQVQRYLSCRSERDAVIAVVVNCVLLNFILALVMFVGLICVSHFMDCDPILSGAIKRSDQMVPLMVIQLMSDLPGMTGLIISAAYCGTLSTVSTGIHSMATVVLEDFVRPFFLGASEKQMTIVSKFLTLFFGLFTLVIAFGASKLDFILQAALSVWGVVGGPLVGVFTLGVFFPFVNWYGAIVGQFSGFCVTLWVAVGAQWYKSHNIYTNKLSTSIDNCTITNLTTIVLVDFDNIRNATSMAELTVPSVDHAMPDVQIYFLSYLYYAVLAATTTVVVGVVVSAVTGFDKVELCLLCPLARKYSLKLFKKFIIDDSEKPIKQYYEVSPQVNDDMSESLPLNDRYVMNTSST